MNTQANVSAANGVVNDSNMAQIQQLLQLLNSPQELEKAKKGTPEYDK
jgi:hypothetical protein